MMPAIRNGNSVTRAAGAMSTGETVTDQDERRRLLDAWLALTDPAADYPGTVSLPMLTGSMAPVIPVGARLQIAAARRRAFGVGSVVVFSRGDKLVAHRLLFGLGIGPGALYLEKGDWNAKGGLIRRREVRGVVIGWLANGTPETPHLVPVPRSRSAAIRSFLRSIRILARGFPGR